MSRRHDPSLMSLAALLLAGCAGGGGSGGGSTPPSSAPVISAVPIATDTSLVTLTPLTQLVVSNERSVDIDPGAIVSELSFQTTLSLRTSAGAPQEVNLSIAGLNRTVSFTTADFTTDVWRSGSPYTIASASRDLNASETIEVLLFRPASGSLEYHSFGAWSYATTGGAAHIDVFVAGSPTAAASIPTTGTATYSGVMDANHIAPNVFDSLSAFATGQADFAARTVTLSTSGSQRTDLLVSGATPVAAPGFDILPSTLTWQAGTNALGGTLTTVNGLSGSTSATFFGPAAAELGGTFRLDNGTTSNNLIGGYSMKR